MLITMFDLSSKSDLFFLCQILRVARQLGDFLLVGVHADQTVRYVGRKFFRYFHDDQKFGCL